jgi:hypothetical protein
MVAGSCPRMSVTKEETIALADPNLAQQLSEVPFLVMLDKTVFADRP